MRIMRAIVAIGFICLLAGTAVADFIPPELPAGSQYQILLVTADGIWATPSNPSLWLSSVNLTDYNTFVQNEASLSPTLPSATWSALVSTTTFNANQASSTTNIPIYDTQGDLLEPNFQSLFTDPLLFNNPNVFNNNWQRPGYENPLYDQYGNPRVVPVWTGTVYPGVAGQNPLGCLSPTWGWSGFNQADAGPFLWYDNVANTMYYNDFSIYAISSPITVPSTCAMVLQITSIAVSGNDINLVWSTTGGTTNVVQATNGDASGGYNTNGFADISGLIIIGGTCGTSTNYLDSGGAIAAPSRFYRVRQAP